MNQSKQPELEILYEDNHLIAVNKPAGILTQGDHTGEKSLLEMVKEYIKEKYNKPGNVYLGMVHRLDKPVSGIIIFAKTSKAAARLCKEIKNHKMDKIYISVNPITGQNDITKYREWKEIKSNIVRIKDKSFIKDNPTKDSQKGVLKLKNIFHTERYSINLIKLITGRKHQIRCQFSHLKAPICGDKKYGSAIPFKKNRIALHSIYCKITHPTKKEPVEIVTEIPKEFLTLLEESHKEEISEALKKNIKNYGTF